MREFFKEWKRKVGTFTLLLAGLFMAGWIRSYSTTDDHITVWKEHSLYSHNGSLSWNVHYAARSWPRNKSLPNNGWAFDTEIISRREFCGLVHSDTVWSGGGVRQYWIAHWYFTSPLILLSAWLLLSWKRHHE